MLKICQSRFLVTTTQVRNAQAVPATQTGRIKAYCLLQSIFSLCQFAQVQVRDTFIDERQDSTGIFRVSLFELLTCLLRKLLIHVGYTYVIQARGYLHAACGFSQRRITRKTKESRCADTKKR